MELLAANGKFLHAGGRGGAIFFQQFRKLFEIQHARAAYVLNRRS